MVAIKRNIYMLYSCNKNKTIESMTLKMVTTGKNRIKKEIQRQIKNKNMKFNIDCALSDFQISEINEILEYGFIKIVIDGAIQD